MGRVPPDPPVPEQGTAELTAGGGGRGGSAGTTQNLRLFGVFGAERAAQRLGPGRGRAAKPTQPRKVLGPRPLPCSGMCPRWVLGSTPVPAARCCPSCGSQSAPVLLPPGLRCVPVRHSAQTSRAGSGRSPSPVPSANQCDQQPPALLGRMLPWPRHHPGSQFGDPRRALLPRKAWRAGTAPVRSGGAVGLWKTGFYPRPPVREVWESLEMPSGNAISVPRWSILAAPPGSSSD